MQSRYEKPTCQSVCPISKCIIVDPDNVETEDELLEKFVIIQGLANKLTFNQQLLTLFWRHFYFSLCFS